MSKSTIPPSLDDLLNDGETLLSQLKKILINQSKTPGYYKICELGIAFLNELFKISQSRYYIIGELYNNIFQFYPPLNGIISWMSQPDRIFQRGFEETSIFLDQTRYWLSCIDYHTKYYLLQNMVYNNQYIGILVDTATNIDGYLFLTYIGYRFSDGEEIKKSYYDKLTNLHICETTLNNRIIG